MRPAIVRIRRPSAPGRYWVISVEHGLRFDYAAFESLEALLDFARARRA